MFSREQKNQDNETALRQQLTRNAQLFEQLKNDNLKLKEKNKELYFYKKGAMRIAHEAIIKEVDIRNHHRNDQRNLEFMHKQITALKKMRWNYLLFGVLMALTAMLLVTGIFGLAGATWLGVGLGVVGGSIMVTFSAAFFLFCIHKAVKLLLHPPPALLIEMTPCRTADQIEKIQTMLDPDSQLCEEKKPARIIKSYSEPALSSQTGFYKPQPVFNEEMSIQSEQNSFLLSPQI